MTGVPAVAPKRPLILNNALFILTLIALAAACVSLVGIPFVLAALFYLLKSRTEALQLVASRDQANEQVHQASIQVQELEAIVEQVGAMDIIERQKFIEHLDSEISSRRGQVRHVEAEINAAQSQATQLRVQVLDLQASSEVNDYGLYNFENPAQDSVRLGEQLKEVQTRIKDAVRDKRAANGSQNFTLDGSIPRGRKMVGDMTKLLLRAFNAEAENCIKTVKAGRLTTAETRLDKSAEAVERLGKSMSITISREYLDLRKYELQLTHQHLAALRTAKEEERAERERQRDDERAQKEFEAAKAKQMKEVNHFQAALEQLRAAGDFEGAAAVEAQLVSAQELLDDIRERMTQTRAGHVYVISNVGAFGRGMVKIGMTRRMTPEDRVRELGDASVPFLFDQHAMIFSPDAFGLEAALHQHFADRRVNLVNLRREYFYATPAEVKHALGQMGDAHILEFHEEWTAPEFTQSKVLREEHGLPLVPEHASASLMESVGL